MGRLWRKLKCKIYGCDWQLTLTPFWAKLVHGGDAQFHKCIRCGITKIEPNAKAA